MRLFDVGKIPTYCEGIAHRIERRKSGDVKVVDLTLRIDPFSQQMAAALDQSEYGFVKRMLFRMNDGEPIRDLRSIEFKPPADRQNIHCFASPDTPDASICLPQIKITKMRVRSQKDGDRWVFYIYASYGPLGKTELEYVNSYYTEQRFITFEEAEPLLEFEEDDDEDAEPGPVVDGRVPAPMWDDDEQPAAAADKPAALAFPKKAKPGAVAANRKLHSHQSKKKGKK